VKRYVLRHTNLFVLYEIRRNCHSGGRNLLLYQFIKRLIRPILIIIEESPSYRLPKKSLSNILLAKLTPYVNEVIGDQRCGFRRNRSAMDQIFHICQMLEKKWEYYRMVHQLFVDFKKAYESVKRDVL
jgi:hypothetical protein